MARKNALYTSYTIQNDIIYSIIGYIIQEQIVEDIHRGSRVFSINAAEVQVVVKGNLSASLTSLVTQLVKIWPKQSGTPYKA